MYFHLAADRALGRSTLHLPDMQHCRQSLASEQAVPHPDQLESARPQVEQVPELAAQV
jgi:hypothetical protein